MCKYEYNACCSQLNIHCLGQDGMVHISISLQLVSITAGRNDLPFVLCNFGTLRKIKLHFICTQVEMLWILKQKLIVMTRLSVHLMTEILVCLVFLTLQKTDCYD